MYLFILVQQTMLIINADWKESSTKNKLQNISCSNIYLSCKKDLFQTLSFSTCNVNLKKKPNGRKIKNYFMLIKYSTMVLD